MFALLLTAASAATAGPLPTRDQHPLLGGLGLPTAMPATLPAQDAWSLATGLNWGSSALIQRSVGESLIVDAETQEWRVTLERSFSERLAFRLRIPYRRISGGSLDGFIDGWHDFFSLPEGARPQLPQDQLAIAYARHGAPTFEWNSAASGLGDIAGSLGFALHADPASSVTVWLGVELPTGEAAKLTGNEAFDANVILAGQRRLGERISVYGQASLTWLGQGEVLRRRQRDFVWGAVAGVSWRAFQRVELKAQLDARTAVFDDTALDFLDEALMLSVGGAIHLGSGWRLELGVSEDIAVETAPDVVFLLSVGKAAGR